MADRAKDGCTTTDPLIHRALVTPKRSAASPAAGNGCEGLPTRLFLPARAHLFPSRDPCISGFLVLAGRSGDADRSDELAIKRDRDAAVDQIDLVSVHVHDAEVAVGLGLVEFRHGLRSRPVHD